MKRGVALRLAGLISAMFLLQANACDTRVANYEKLGRMEEIDPATGDTIITQFWKHGTLTTATFKRIPKGNTDRRREPLPPVGDLD